MDRDKKYNQTIRWLKVYGIAFAIPSAILMLNESEPPKPILDGLMMFLGWLGGFTWMNVLSPKLKGKFQPKEIINKFLGFFGLRLREYK